MQRNLRCLIIGLVASLALVSCAPTRTPTVQIPPDTVKQELVSKSQKVANFNRLEVPFVLASAPKSAANVDLKFHILTRGF